MINDLFLFDDSNIYYVTGGVKSIGMYGYECSLK